jgi:hypothetical protein
VNVALSVALVRRFGLVGVAVGTLIPVCLVLMLVVFPAGCRRVEVTVADAFRHAVWPALWPASVMALYVFVTKSMVPNALVAVAAEYGMAALVYVTTFVMFGISATERQFYLGKIAELARRNALAPVSESA